MKTNFRATLSLLLFALAARTDAAPLHLTAGASTATNFHFTLSGPAGAAGSVEQSEDWVHWLILTDFALPPSGDPLVLTDPQTAGLTNRYYRARASTNRSDNAVGFVRMVLPPGFTAASNPLNDPRGNNLSVFMPSPPPGTVVYPFGRGGYSISVFDDLDLVWVPNALQFHFGEAFFVHIPVGANYTNTFIGEVLQGSLTNRHGAGFSFRGSMVPQRGPLTSVLGFTPLPATSVYQFSNDSNGYRLYTFDDLDGIWLPTEPELDIGEGVFIHSPANQDWVREFSVWP